MTDEQPPGNQPGQYPYPHYDPTPPQSYPSAPPPSAYPNMPPPGYASAPPQPYTQGYPPMTPEQRAYAQPYGHQPWQAPRQGTPPRMESRIRGNRIVSIIARVLLVLPVLAEFNVVRAIRGQRNSIRDAIEEIRATGTFTEGPVKHADHVANTANIFLVLSAIVAAVPFIWWLWRLRGDADWFDPYVHRRSKGWTIGAWIVPVVSLWFPYQVVADISKANQPRPTQYDDRKVPALIKVWWLMFIVLAVGNRIVTASSPDTPDGFTTALNFEVAAAVLSIATAIVAIVVVEMLTRSNARRWPEFVATQQPWQPPY